MYFKWTNITERDLIHKGASYKKVKTNLNIEKVVLNMTLPTMSIGTSLGFAGGKIDSNIKKKKSSNSKNDNLNKTDLEGSIRDSILNLSVMSLLAIISGQRPVLTKARKSIANWKVRQNQILGFKVTLRGNSALEFLDKTVRFQNINELDIFTNPNASLSNKSGKDLIFLEKTKFGIFRKKINQIKGNYSLQSLGNISVGIKNMNFYPELEDFWLAQSIGQKANSTNQLSLLGLDLSINFKKSKELSQVINSILRKSGGKNLVDNYSKNIQSFPSFIKTNKSVLALKNILILRHLYLTSIGFYPQVSNNLFE
jgi:ribosomal protein L5